MSTFKYRVMTRGSGVLEGKRASVSKAALLDYLKKSGHIVLKVEEVGGEKGGKFLGYVGMAKYPWNLAKANLAKHWHDQDVMVVIFHNVKQAVKELEVKEKKNDLTMRDELELDRGRRWLKDYRRRKDNEGRKKRRSKAS